MPNTCGAVDDNDFYVVDAPEVAKYTLRQLEYFVAVAEAGTITGAARATHLSQSAMSTSLADLERSLAVQLVLRHHARGITLTREGQELLVEARRLLAQAGDLQSLAAHLGGAVTGEFTLGCFAILAPYVLPALLTAAETELPQLVVHTSEEPLDSLTDGLISGRLELALGYDIATHPQLEAHVLASVPPHVVLPQGHRLANRSRITLSSLAKEPLVMIDLPHSRDYFAKLFASAGVVPHIRHRTHSADLAKALVARGGGYTVLNLNPSVSTSLEGVPYTVVPLDVPRRGDAHLRVVLTRVRGSRPTRRAHAIAALCQRIVPALIRQM